MVPNPEAAAAEVAAARVGNPRAEMLEVVVYDDIPDLLQGAPMPGLGGPQPAGNGSAWNATNAGMLGGGQGTSWTHPNAGRSEAAGRTNQAPTGQPTNLVLVSRQVLYVQALLFCLVALLAFGAGYFIGRGKPLPESKEAKAATAAQTVGLKGTITYVPAAGIAEADDNSVVICLPRTPPARKLAVRGLRPRDDEAGFQKLATDTVHENGGDCVRTDETGSFHVVVPQPGDYYLLMISRKASRGANEPIRAADISQMTPYFESINDLIGASQYRWSAEHLAGIPAPIAQRFGAGAK
jgi:hypothetical protein